MIRLRPHRVGKAESLFVENLKPFSTASTHSGSYRPDRCGILRKRIHPKSFDLQIRLADDLSILGIFVLEPGREFVRCAADRIKAQRIEALLDVRLLHDT